MAFIRALHIKRYHRNKQRFDKSFNNCKGSISVFRSDCVESKGNSICRHIEEYYPSTVGTPALYFILPDDALSFFEGIRIEDTLSFPNNDNCHSEFFNVENSRGNEFERQYIKPPNVYICINGRARPLTQNEFEDLLGNIENGAFSDENDDLNTMHRLIMGTEQ